MTDFEPRRIVLIIQDEGERELYNQILRARQDIVLESYGRIEEFQKGPGERRFFGFIVDLRTVIRSTNEEKRVFMNISSVFPVLRIRKGEGAAPLTGLVAGQIVTGDGIFDFFIDEACSGFQPRGLRTSERRPAILNVLATFDPDRQAQEPCRANIINISDRGFFIACTHDVDVGRQASVVINEFINKAPILSVIKWGIRWGQSTRHLPGFGAEIVHITQEQSDELAAFG